MTISEQIEKLEPVMPQPLDIANGILMDIEHQKDIPELMREGWLKNCIRDRVFFAIEAAKYCGMYKTRKALTAPPTETEIEAVARVLAVHRHNSESYSRSYRAVAKAAISAFLKGRGGGDAA